jgi:hypothetical protein
MLGDNSSHGWFKLALGTTADHKHLNGLVGSSHGSF